MERWVSPTASAKACSIAAPLRWTMLPTLVIKHRCLAGVEAMLQQDLGRELVSLELGLHRENECARSLTTASAAESPWPPLRRPPFSPDGAADHCAEHVTR